MARWYVNYGNGSSTGYYAVAQWAAGHAYSVGNIVRQLATPTVGNERCFRCTTAGTSGGSEPAWSLSKGATTSDGSVVWTEVTGNEAYQATNAWSAPHARIPNACSWAAAGDTIVVGSNHAETSSSIIEIVSPGLNSFIVVVNPATASVPPVSGDLTTGATVTTTGSQSLRIDGSFDLIRGIAFTGGGALQIAVFSSTGARQHYKNCSLATTAAFTAPSFGNNNLSAVILENTPINFNANQVSVESFLHWKNTPSAVLNPTSVNFQLGTNTPVNMVIENCDLSGFGSNRIFNEGTAMGGLAQLRGCKLASGTVPIQNQSPGSTQVDLMQCDNGSNLSSKWRLSKYRYHGTQTLSASVAKASGSSDSVAYSIQIATNANSTWNNPFEAFPVIAYNPTTAANVTVTMYGIWNAAALPNNDDVWFDVDYLGDSADLILTTKSGSKSDLLAANAALTADASDWTAGASARQNTHAYVSGDVIKLASNSGRLFFCTTGGTSAGSEPAGYASAVDGGTVTDGGATFRAGVRFKLAVTLTSPQPQQAGTLFAKWKAAKASSTFFLDANPTLS